MSEEIKVEVQTEPAPRPSFKKHFGAVGDTQVWIRESKGSGLLCDLEVMCQVAARPTCPLPHPLVQLLITSDEAAELRDGNGHIACVLLQSVEAVDALIAKLEEAKRAATQVAADWNKPTGGAS